MCIDDCLFLCAYGYIEANSLTRQKAPSMTLAERIERLSIPEPNSGCWLWLGYARRNPVQLRPKIAINGHERSAHRVALEVFKGPIPSGVYACHTCHNTMCVNPEHLYPGTAKQNTQDMMRAGRHFSQNNPIALQALKIRIKKVGAARRAARFCKQGHLLEGDNLYFHAPTNRRRCKTCRERYRKEYNNV